MAANKSLDDLDHNFFDDFEDLFKTQWLNWSMLALYLSGLASCVGLGLVSWYERTGRAGPHRTLVNRLVSMILDQVIIHYIFGHGIATLRAVAGPLGSVLCGISSFANIFAGMNVCLLSVGITLTKYCFACVYKRIPNMDDNLVSFMMSSNIYMMSFLGTGAKFYLNSAKTMDEKICLGTEMIDSEERKMTVPIASFVAIGSLLGHIILNIPIAIEKYKDQALTAVVPFNHQNSNMSNLGNTFVRISIALIIVIGTLVNGLLRMSKVENLKEFPMNILLVHGNNTIVPFLAVTILCFIFLFTKNLSIKRALFPDGVTQGGTTPA